MKKIVMVGISIFLLSACGGGGSGSPKKGPLSSQNPMDRIAGGIIDSQRYTIVATPAAHFSSMLCSKAKGFIFIKNNIVTGTIVSGFKMPYIISGTYIPETGNINGGFAEAQQSIAQYRGTINLSKGNGTWSDDFGCSGVWEAIVEK